MKRILLLATGGTIASRPAPGGGLAPAIEAAELLRFVPELGEVCEIASQQLCNLDSTDLGPAQWLALAAAVREQYDRYDGFVITHGTDTMAYTAAALCYLVQNAAKPIVLTGSQRSIYDRDTDARLNLLRAFQYAGSTAAWGVHIVFDGKVILGTRARKLRTKSYDAFASIDWPESAVFRAQKLVPFAPPPAVAGPPRFYDRLDPRVFVLRLLPGMTAEALDLLCPQYHALVLEGFGVGGLPGGQGGELLQAVKRWGAAGRLVVFSTQVQHEGSDLSVYEVGRIAKDLPGVLEARDMTPEAVVTKLMWALGQTADAAKAAELFARPVLHDIL